MHDTDNNYKLIITSEHITEYKLVIAGQTYYNSDIISGNVEGSLFNDFGIGNTFSRSISLELIPKGNIPSISQIELFIRIFNDSLVSGWIPKGVFFIDTRIIDEDGIMHITGFDAMLKTEVTFFKSGSWVSSTAYSIASRIATDIGVTIDADTSILLASKPYMITHIPEIGENGTTSRQMLGYIAAMFGGNWIIDDVGHLKLYVLTDIPPEADDLLIDESSNCLLFGEDLIIVE